MKQNVAPPKKYGWKETRFQHFVQPNVDEGWPQIMPLPGTMQPIPSWFWNLCWPCLGSSRSLYRGSHTWKIQCNRMATEQKCYINYIQSIPKMISNKSPVSQQKTLFIQKKWRLSPIFTTTCGTTKPRNLAGNVLAPKTRDIWRKHHAHEHNGGFRTCFDELVPLTARTLGNIQLEQSPNSQRNPNSKNTPN